MNRLQGRRESVLPPVRPDSSGSGVRRRSKLKCQEEQPDSGDDDQDEQENRKHRRQIPEIPPQAAAFQFTAQLLAALAAQPPAIFAFLIRFIRDEGADNFAKPLHLRGGL